MVVECIVEDLDSDVKFASVVVFMAEEYAEEDAIDVCLVDGIIIVDAGVADVLVRYLFVDLATVVFPLVTVT